MPLDEDSYKKVLDVMIKPNLESIDPETSKIRRNLYVVSIISVFIGYASKGIVVDQSSIFGIRFNELNTDVAMYILLAIQVYFFCHFSWAMRDYWEQQRQRLTGLDVTKDFMESCVNPQQIQSRIKENKNSTLHGWFFQDYQRYLEIEHNIELMKEYGGSRMIAGDKRVAIGAIENFYNQLNQTIPYINQSLRRYDDGFFRLRKSQCYRWFILDFGIPFLCGIAGITGLIKVIFYTS